MDLQTLFYIVSIACMLSIILALVLLGISAWKIKQQVQKFPLLAKTALAGFALTKRKELLSATGVTIATAVFAKLKDRFFDSKSKKR